MIHCIGDSHVYVFSGIDVIPPSHDALPFFRTYRLGPHTAYNALKQLNVVEQIIQSEVHPGDAIMFCFGEIDCRAHLIKQSEVQKKPLEDVVHQCVERYFKIFESTKTYGFPLLAWNVPPTSPESIDYGEFSTYGTYEERCEVTVLFNSILHGCCEKNGVVFISIYDRLLDRDGLRNPALFMDSIHLSQNVMPFILDRLRNKGVHVNVKHTGASTEYLKITSSLKVSNKDDPFLLKEDASAKQNQHLASVIEDENKNGCHRATDASDTALSNCANNAEAHYVNARLCIQTDRHEEAIKHLEQVIALDPSHAKAYDDLGVICHQKGEYKRALELFIVAHSLDNLNYNALRNIVAISKQLGLAGSAMDLVKTIREEYPDDKEFIEIAEKSMSTPPRKKQVDSFEGPRLLINIVYEHLQENQIYSANRGNVTVVWSSLPLEEFDLYAYLNSSSFRGRHSGAHVLIMLEPIVVLPGEYNESVWNHFDHVFSLCDALSQYGRRFTKIIFPRSGWISAWANQSTITEDIKQRNQKYPLGKKMNALCMINGNKRSVVPSELYSKRVEAAQWFYNNSDIPFDVYGNPPFPLPNYKGVLAPDTKLDILSQYKYCLCFENTDHPRFSAGYISEKILDCMETRTIPIYLGCVNIEEYIPQDCFIDFRNFADYSDLNDFLHVLSNKGYEAYISNIDSWVSRGGLRSYSWHTIYNQLVEAYAAGTDVNIDDLLTPTSNWQDGTSPSCDIKKCIPITSPSLWTWHDLAGGNSQLLTDTALPGTGLNNPYVLHFQNMKSEHGSLRIELLKDLVNVFGLDTFVETGTYLGDTSYAASNVFQSVHTIELSTDLYQKALKRFKDNTNIHIYNGDSGNLFPELFHKINGKVLFWLDGHYSEGPTAKGDENTPIIKEINAIKDARIRDAVILIDDLRFFDTVWDVIPENSAARGYPSVVSLCNAIHEIDEAYRFAVVGDIFMAYPASAVFDVTPVVSSCTISRLYDGTNVSLEQIMEAEASIGKAQSAELFALQKLFATCAGIEGYGLGKHYRLWHALILASHEDYMKACKEFLMAMNLGHDHWRINWYLANAAYMAGNYTLASQQLTIVSMTAPDHIETHRLLTKIDALKHSGAEENAFSSQDRIELAHHYLGAAKFDKATNELEAGLQRDPDNPDIRYWYAKLHIATGQYEKAIPELQRVLGLNSTCTGAHNDLGEIYLAMNDSKRALEHFMRAISIDNRNYPALINLLNVMIKAGQFEEAANIIRAILERSPDDASLIRIAEQFIAIEKEGKKIHTETASSNTTAHEIPFIGLKRKAAEYYKSIVQHYQLASSDGLVNRFVHPVWIKQLNTLGEMITAGLPDNFLLHPICLEMFVRVGWNPQQEYELTYIKNTDENLRNRIYSLKESPIGQIPHDCGELNISVNTLGMLWYYARISEFMSDSPSSIVEFGGGFGSLARIFKILSHKPMTYTIIDLPEMLSLQYYFLSTTIGEAAVVAHISSGEEVVRGKINLFPVYGMENINLSSDLFISTFAISESPEMTQNLVCIAKNFFSAPYIYITGQLTGERSELSWQTPNTIVMSALHLRRHIAMNHFHIGNNYELMGSHKTVGIERDVMSERQRELNDKQQRAQHKAPYAENSHLSYTVLAIVFSKDRAMQLDCAIRSFTRHCKYADDSLTVKVLYATSNDVHERQYQKLAKDYPSIEFVKETDFKNNFLQVLTLSEYVLFLVDDNIFVNDFSTDHIVDVLRQYSNAIGFSLRLGRNTNYCYMLRKQQAPPAFYSAGNGVLCYDWPTAECDFGYPLEVSSSLYRTSDLLPLLAQADYKNPNTLEVLLDINKPGFAASHDALLCFESSVAFCNPLNIVQTAWTNRVSGNDDYSPGKLAELFDNGYRIDIDAFRGFVPGSCHQEEELKFIKVDDGLRECTSQEPQVSIVILHQNGLDNIRLNLESIKRNTPEAHEIIVFDNASSDGSNEYLRSITDIVLIESPENIGCTSARAKAMSITRGKYLILLDNDTIVTNGWVTKFLDLADKNPHIGLMGPSSNYVSGQQLVSSASYKSVEEMEMFANRWSEEHRDELLPIFRLVGFCMFIRRELFDKIGVIDESLGFFGFDDDDYSLRAYLAGFNPSIAKGIFIHHTGGLQGRGDQQVNRALLDAWELYKTKWGISMETPYGAPYEISPILAQPFNKQKHFCEPFPKAMVNKMLYHAEAGASVRQDCVFETNMATNSPSSIHPESIKGVTSIIITVSQFNDNLRKCLDSININIAEPYEIILAKIGLQKAPGWLKKYIAMNTRCRIVGGAKNMSYAAICNEALEILRGQYVLLLDGNTILFKGSFEKLRECLDRKPEHGMTVPMSNNAIGPQQIPKTQLMSFKAFEEYAEAFGKRNRYRHIETFEMDSFCVLIKRELIDIIGLFNNNIENQFFVMNDYRIRALLEGYQTVISGDACLYRNRDGLRKKGSDKAFREQWDICNPHSAAGQKIAPFIAIKMAGDYHRKGLLKESVQTIVDGIKCTPKDEGLYYFLAEILFEEKSYQESIDAIQAMPEPGKNKARVLEMLAYCRYHLGNIEEAEDYADQALSLSGNSAKALNLKGLVAMKQGDRTKAMALFQQAISIDPGFANPYVNIGVMNWHNNKREEALNLIEKGFILSPETADFSTTYSSAITSLNELTRAEKVVVEAAGLFPGNKRLSFLLIDILLQQEKHAEAMKEIEKAMLTFGIVDEILPAALTVREKIGPLVIGRSGNKTGTLSVSMIAKNEEKYIARCLSSIAPIADEIIVVDTGSTDRTKDIAKAFGARVYDLPWTDDFSASRNHSLSFAKGQWVLVHDADEVISPLDYDKLKELMAKKTEQSIAYTLTTRTYTNNPSLEGWTLNSGEYPDEEEGTGWCPTIKTRLFRNDHRIRFQNQVHELLEPSLAKAGITIKHSTVPVHHYGKLDQDRSLSRAEMYFELGKAKIMSFQDTKALRELAIQAGELGKHTEALGLWDLYIQYRQDDHVAYFNMSTSYLEKGEFEKALLSAKTAMDINPQSKEAQLGFATSSLCWGNIAEAIGVLEDLLKKEPGYVTAIGALAAAYCIGNNTEKGVALLRDMQAKRYDFGNALHSLCKNLIKAGRDEYAKLLLESMLITGHIHQNSAAVAKDLNIRLQP